MFLEVHEKFVVSPYSCAIRAESRVKCIEGLERQVLPLAIVDDGT